MIELLILFVINVGIFLIGMLLLKFGLYFMSARKLKTWLTKFTKTPLQGFIAGTVITALLQSSSAVMVVTIGLVTAQYLTFRQSLGIILGTNIGSTITTEIITLDIAKGSISLCIIGSLLVLFARGRMFFSLGTIFVGFACAFFAMDGFQQLAEPLSFHPTVHELLMNTNDSFLFGIIVGTILTSIIQSSAATLGIAMGFLTEHIVTLPAGIAILLGANIGTCVTGLLASIGSSYEAKLTAYTHLWLNIIGVFAFYPFIHSLASLAEKLATSPDVQLAHISVLFNAICSVVALPFTRWMEKCILFLHGKRPSV
jgi:phosphate:Na+ symporter